VSKYATTNTTIPAPAEPLSDAFKAGVKSALPEVITFGRVSHHADTRISDISVAMMRELKMNEDGPAQMSGTMTFLTAESMVAAHALYAEPRTRLFADVENRKITAIFDFLNPNPADAPVTGWGQFKGEISFRDSRKLKEWSKLTDWTGQSDFANFLEDHLEDVETPTGADLLAIATDLEANSARNGDVRLDYQSDTQTSVEVPKELILGIPLFEHGERYAVKARLSFRVTGGGVVFRLLFTNLDDAIETEFERIVQVMEEKTSSVILRGRSAPGY